MIASLFMAVALGGACPPYQPHGCGGDAVDKTPAACVVMISPIRGIDRCKIRFVWDRHHQRILRDVTRLSAN